jgi:hypothetical protein
LIPPSFISIFCPRYEIEIYTMRCLAVFTTITLHGLIASASTLKKRQSDELDIQIELDREGDVFLTRQATVGEPMPLTGSLSTSVKSLSLQSGSGGSGIQCTVSTASGETAGTFSADQDFEPESNAGLELSEVLCSEGGAAAPPAPSPPEETETPETTTTSAQLTTTAAASTTTSATATQATTQVEIPTLSKQPPAQTSAPAPETPAGGDGLSTRVQVEFENEDADDFRQFEVFMDQPFAMPAGLDALVIAAEVKEVGFMCTLMDAAGASVGMIGGNAWSGAAKGLLYPQPKSVGQISCAVAT